MTIRPIKVSNNYLSPEEAIKLIESIPIIKNTGNAMTFPRNLDFDRIINITLSDLGIAITGWLNGMPKDEVALLNRITERLNRNRRGCDVGLSSPCEMTSQLYHLHRKGQKQTDLYGADLAITVKTKDKSLFKTALFQFKKSSDLKCNIEKAQLYDAICDFRTKDRSFIFAVDEVRHCIRIESVNSILSAFGPQKSMDINTSSWESLTHWLWQWLSCQTGVASKENDPQSIETLLGKYKVQPPLRTAWERGEPEPYGGGDNMTPARTWLSLDFH